MENCRTKISHWSRIINQFVPSAMSELVWILFVVANVIVKVIINASFYHHVSYIILLRVKGSIHTPIAHLPMFLIMFPRKGKIVWKVVWIFAAELVFLKILVPRIPQHTSNVDIESTRKLNVCVLYIWSASWSIDTS